MPAPVLLVGFDCIVLNHGPRFFWAFSTTVLAGDPVQGNGPVPIPTFESQNVVWIHVFNTSGIPEFANWKATKHLSISVDE